MGKTVKILTVFTTELHYDYIIAASTVECTVADPGFKWLSRVYEIHPVTLRHDRKQATYAIHLSKFEWTAHHMKTDHLGHGSYF